MPRARMAKTPEQSDHTSIQQRIKKAINTQQPGRKDRQPETLFPFVGNPRKDMPQGLPFQLNDYLELVDWKSSLSTSPDTSNIRSKTWSVQHTMCARHVSQLARTGYMV